MTRAAGIAVNALIYLFILSPILIIIPVSFSQTQYVVFPPHGLTLRWYYNFFNTPELVGSALLSLRLASLSTLVGSTLGIMVSMAVVRHRFPGRELVRAFFMAPLVIPGIVLGIALLIFLSKTVLAGHFAALLVAHVVVVLPYVIRTVTASLYGLDPALEQAAMSLGAAPLTVPEALLRQLRVGGRLIVPIGPEGEQELVRLTRLEQGFGREVLGSVAFVPLLGGTA